MVKLASLLLAMAYYQSSFCQENTLKQNIRGVVIDADSKMGLGGAEVFIVGINRSSTTDSFGTFKFVAVPIGEYHLQVNREGYESTTVLDLTLTSGKEFLLTIELNEKITTLSEIKIKTTSQNTPRNDFAASSVHTLSMDDVKRYPATGNDPARMAQNFAGVSMNEDNSNEVVIRGNSPRGILWKLEGIEIPGPNHFGLLGSGGGNIGMLSSYVLDKSDFYTGAFPAEFGNALSGVFDLRLRKGNKETREHFFQFGTLGMEAGSEGPITQKKTSSYLFNARYSTLAMLKSFATIQGIAPDYQDASFKVHFPSQYGNVSIWGLGGVNRSLQEPESFGLFIPRMTIFRNEEKAKLGIIGLTHELPLTKTSYLKTVVALSDDQYKNQTDTLNVGENYRKEVVGRSSFTTFSLRTSLLISKKFNARNNVQAGIILSKTRYGLLDEVYETRFHQWRTFMESSGKTEFYQSFIQWKRRVNQKFLFITGLHSSYLHLNRRGSIEPRIALSYLPGSQKKITLSGGLHSKPEHVAVYLFQYPGNVQNNAFPNKNLLLTKAAQITLAFMGQCFWGTTLNIESYYQHLYNVPVEKNPESFFSMINATNVFDLYDTDSSLVSSGKGRNHGVDISISKKFQDQFYSTLITSFFASSYSTFEGKEFHTKFSRGYQAVFIGSNSWSINDGQKKVGLTGKFISTGSLRSSLVDKEQSRAEGAIVYAKDQYYTQQGKAYLRVDLGFYFAIYKKALTHTLSLDVQNITDRKNVLRSSYNVFTGRISEEFGLGIFPLLNYKLHF
jgi:hypothetical protein